MVDADFLDIYLNLQHGIIFDKLLNVLSRDVTITFCQPDEATYWNFARVKRGLTEHEVTKLEQKFIELKRTPSVYFENKKDFSYFEGLLQRKGYKKSYEDSWMFYEKDSVQLPDDYQVITVSNEKELLLFLDILNTCYQKNDPQNPYGELSKGILKITSDAWYKYHQTQRVEYFIFYHHNSPVSVSSLIYYKDYGYIWDLGSLPSVRGKGFGKLATLYSVKKSIEKGNKYHFLATETGHYPNNFYQRIGFRTKFTAIDYFKP